HRAGAAGDRNLGRRRHAADQRSRDAPEHSAAQSSTRCSPQRRETRRDEPRMTIEAGAQTRQQALARRQQRPGPDEVHAPWARRQRDRDSRAGRGGTADGAAVTAGTGFGDERRTAATSKTTVATSASASLRASPAGHAVSPSGV